MWGKEKEREAGGAPVREVPSYPAHHAAPAAERAPEPAPAAPARTAMAAIGKTVSVKGQITASEDLFIDGEVEGTVDLKDNNITVGPNGRVNASLIAKDVIIQGRVKGNVRANDRLEIRKTGSLLGDIVTARVVIEDGAYFKGSIDIQKPGGKTEHRTETRTEAPAAMGAGAGASPPSAATAVSAGLNLGDARKI